MYKKQQTEDDLNTRGIPDPQSRKKKVTTTCFVTRQNYRSCYETSFTCESFITNLLVNTHLFNYLFSVRN